MVIKEEREKTFSSMSYEELKIKELENELEECDERIEELENEIKQLEEKIRYFLSK